MRRMFVVLAMIFVAIGCTTANKSQTTNKTKTTLEKYTGRTISDFVNDLHYYPDSQSDLPNGDKVYRFSIGSGGQVDQFGNVRSNICRWSIETDVHGVIRHWRYENCG